MASLMGGGERWDTSTTDDMRVSQSIKSKTVASENDLRRTVDKLNKERKSFLSKFNDQKARVFRRLNDIKTARQGGRRRLQEAIDAMDGSGASGAQPGATGAPHRPTTRGDCVAPGRSGVNELAPDEPGLWTQDQQNGIKSRIKQGADGADIVDSHTESRNVNMAGEDYNQPRPATAISAVAAGKAYYYNTGTARSESQFVPQLHTDRSEISLGGGENSKTVGRTRRGRNRPFSSPAIHISHDDSPPPPSATGRQEDFGEASDDSWLYYGDGLHVPEQHYSVFLTSVTPPPTRSAWGATSRSGRPGSGFLHVPDNAADSSTNHRRSRSLNSLNDLGSARRTNSPGANGDGANRQGANHPGATESQLDSSDDEVSIISLGGTPPKFVSTGFLNILPSGRVRSPSTRSRSPSASGSRSPSALGSRSPTVPGSRSPSVAGSRSPSFSRSRSPSVSRSRSDKGQGHPESTMSCSLPEIHDDVRAGRLVSTRGQTQLTSPSYQTTKTFGGFTLSDNTGNLPTEQMSPRPMRSNHNNLHSAVSSAVTQLQRQQKGIMGNGNTPPSSGSAQQQGIMGTGSTPHTTGSAVQQGIPGNGAERGTPSGNHDNDEGIPNNQHGLNTSLTSPQSKMAAVTQSAFTPGSLSGAVNKVPSIPDQSPCTTQSTDDNQANLSLSTPGMHRVSNPHNTLHINPHNIISSTASGSNSSSSSVYTGSTSPPAASTPSGNSPQALSAGRQSQQFVFERPSTGHNKTTRPSAATSADSADSSATLDGANRLAGGGGGGGGGLVNSVYSTPGETTSHPAEPAEPGEAGSSCPGVKTPGVTVVLGQSGREPVSPTVRSTVNPPSSLNLGTASPRRSPSKPSSRSGSHDTSPVGSHRSLNVLDPGSLEGRISAAMAKAQSVDNKEGVISSRSREQLDFYRRALSGSKTPISPSDILARRRSATYSSGDAASLQRKAKAAAAKARKVKAAQAQGQLQGESQGQVKVSGDKINKLPSPTDPSKPGHNQNSPPLLPAREKDQSEHLTVMTSPVPEAVVEEVEEFDLGTDWMAQALPFRKRSVTFSGLSNKGVCKLPDIIERSPTPDMTTASSICSQSSNIVNNSNARLKP